MIKFIKNNTNNTQTWVGQEVAPNNYYEIQTHEVFQWANNSTVLSSITNETLIVSKSNDSEGHILDYIEAINYLKDQVLDIDTKGRQINRVAYASPGWTYLAHPIEFQTAKFSSLHNKTYLNSDRSDCTIKFYDSNDAEVTDAQYESSIVKTVVLFKPNYDYEMICGSIRQVSCPSTDVRIWVIGGIIELGGAYVKELVGGTNLAYIGADEEFKTDGRASKYMTKTIPGVPYQGNQIQFIIRHDAGVQHKIMSLLEYYRA